MENEITTRRERQIRTTIIRSVHLDLPPDLSIAVRITAAKAGLSPEALLIDVLRDIFEPIVSSQGEIALGN